MSNDNSSKTEQTTRSIIDFSHLAPIGIVLFFILIGVAVYLVYQDARIMRNLIQDDFNQQQLILARQAARQIDTYLLDIKMELKLLKQLLTDCSSQTLRNELLTAVFERTQSKGLKEMGIIDEEQNILFSKSNQDSPSTNLNEYLPLNEFNPVDEIMLGPLQIEERTTEQSRVVSLIITTVPLPKNEQGVLFAVLDVTKLCQTVMGDLRSGKTGYAWAIENEGITLYHPDMEFVGKNAFEARQERKPFVSFKEINLIMRDRMMQGEEGTSSYESWWHRGIQGQMTKLIAFTPMKSKLLPPGQVWSLAVVAPISEVAEEVAQVQSRSMGAVASIFGGMILFGLMAFLYYRRMSMALAERVSEQEGFISTILQNSVDAIIFVDSDNRVQMWNRGAEMVFGYKAEEMVGQSFHRLIPPDIDAENELNQIRQEVEKIGYIKGYITKRITKDGRKVKVDISRSLIRSKEDHIIGSVAIIKDVTEKMEMESRIYNTEKLASIGTLAAGVAHEINNPLAVILGFTDLLLEKFEPGTPEHDDLKLIEENANNAKKIVENLLGFARITEGMEDVVDINQGLNTVLRIINNTLMTKKVNYKLSIPDGLPKVKGDSREFQQVIFNLINNSVAALGKGGELKISARQENSWVHVTIEDNGSGIPERIKSHIFDPFFTTKKVGEGTGLGLSLCYGIVKKYNGKMNFTSSSKEDYPDEPSGTVFTVSLPAIQEEE